MRSAYLSVEHSRSAALLLRSIFPLTVALFPFRQHTSGTTCHMVLWAFAGGVGHESVIAIAVPLAVVAGWYMLIAHAGSH